MYYWDCIEYIEYIQVLIELFSAFSWRFQDRLVVLAFHSKMSRVYALRFIYSQITARVRSNAPGNLNAFLSIFSIPCWALGIDQLLLFVYIFESGHVRFYQVFIISFSVTTHSLYTLTWGITFLYHVTVTLPPVLCFVMTNLVKMHIFLHQLPHVCYHFGIHVLLHKTDILLFFF